MLPPAIGFTFGGIWGEDDRTNIDNWIENDTIGSFNNNAKRVPQASAISQVLQEIVVYRVISSTFSLTTVSTFFFIYRRCGSMFLAKPAQVRTRTPLYLKFNAQPMLNVLTATAAQPIRAIPGPGPVPM